MKQSKEIKELDCQSNARDEIAEVLSVRFDEVIALRRAALDYSDIEGVHQMRVAMRRLRSALRDFKPFLSRPIPGKLEGKLKIISDALGEVRDADVEIITLEKLLSKANKRELKENLKRLTEERRAHRELVRSNLSNVITAAYIEDLNEEFSLAVTRMKKNPKSAKTLNFNETGKQVVTVGLKQMVAKGSSIYQPFKTSKIHQMRIAAKRLRYAIELFTTCWGEDVLQFADEIANLQTHLGEVHDCDNWIKNLNNKIEQAVKIIPASANSIQMEIWLLSKFVKKRNKHYLAALKLWRSWLAKDFTGNLQILIERNTNNLN